MKLMVMSILGQRAIQRTQLTFFRLATTSADIATSAEPPLEKAKPFHEIPGPPSWPFIKSLWAFLPLVGQYDISRVETSYGKLRDQYGKLVRLNVPGEPPMVMAFDPELIRKIFACEGKFPERPGMKFLKKYRESRPDLYPNLGLFFATGQTWKDLRNSTQKHMMKMPSIREYLPAMEKVAIDFTERIRAVRDEKMEVDNFMNELFKWSLESIGTVALNRRLGCLERHLAADSEPQKLIDAVVTTFAAIHLMEMATGIERFFPGKTYKKLAEAQDYFAAVIYKYLNQAMDDMIARGNVEEGELNLIETFLVNKELSLKEVAVVASDMFFAGIDTTAVATGFILYHLSANPEKQERLMTEIQKLLPTKDTPVTADKLEQMIYLRACVRESMRLTPVLIGTARILSNDIVLDGYHIPAGALAGIFNMVVGRQESIFPQASKFLPERWLRTQYTTWASEEREKAGFSPEYNIQPFASTPFGHGPRMCIGKRIAEQEHHLAIVKILQNYRLEYHHSEKIDVQISAINRPSAPLKIKFHDRK